MSEDCESGTWNLKLRVSKLKMPFLSFWGREERQILAINLGVHTLVQLIALQFMPLAYYSRLSLHDGNTYFSIAQDLWRAQPIEQFSWHKRFLHVLVARLLIPWNLELSFLVAGIVAASLSAVFFYKVVRRFTNQPFRLAVLYSALPWLFFAAHHGLSEPMLMLTVLAGYYYFFEERYGCCTVAFALALVTKELAAFAALGVGLLMIRRRGWLRTLSFGAALIPLVAFCALYGWRWNNCTWCLVMADWNAPEGFFSPRTAIYWIAYWIGHPPASSANVTVAFYYNLANQALNVISLVVFGYAVYAVWRRGLWELAFMSAVLFVMVFFLGELMYQFNHCVGRKFLLLAPSLVAYDGWIADQAGWKRLGYWLLIVGLLALGMLWTFMYAKGFLHYKLF